jgi:hypothetical protein
MASGRRGIRPRDAVTTEQLAIIVPAVAAVLIALLNIWYQRGLTNETLAHQANLTRQTLDHTLSLTTDMRVQERRSDTYVQMLEMLDWIMEIVNATQPVMEPGPPPPPEPDAKVIRPTQARIAAFASPEVKAMIYEQWIPTRNEFFLEADHFRAMRQREMNSNPGRTTIEAPSRKRIASQYQVVDDLRKKLRQIVLDIENQVSDELRS